MTPTRPEIDYAKMPYLPREGIQTAGNNHYATRSLFLETSDAENKPKARWVLSEHEVFAYGFWVPSAWMVYLHADDEYDALRKICGNVRQWDCIKAMILPGRGPFSEVILPLWHQEQAMMQRSRIKNTLTTGALSGGPGYTAAAKMLLQMVDAPPKGRPKKEKAAPKVEDAVAADASRVLLFRK